MSAISVRNWRKNTKLRMVEAMGGRCGNCGYDRCADALEFHHVDPAEKDFTIAGVRASPMAWSKIVAELRKCVMLCANCHREVHAGVAEIAPGAPRFDEAFADYKAAAREARMCDCPVCGSRMPQTKKTCSPACSASARQKVDWSQYDLVEMSRTMSKTEIAAIIGVSDVAIHKRLKKMAPGAGLEPATA